MELPCFLVARFNGCVLGFGGLYTNSFAFILLSHAVGYYIIVGRGREGASGICRDVWGLSPEITTHFQMTGSIPLEKTDVLECGLCRTVPHRVLEK